MSTIIKVLNKLENSSTSKSRQPNSQNIKDVIKKRNKNYKKNYKINYFVLSVIILLSAFISIKYLLKKNTNSIKEISLIKNEVIEKEVVEKETIKKKKIKKIDYFANKVNRKRLNSDDFVNQIEKKQTLYKKKQETILVKIKKKVDWNVSFQLTGILKYGKKNKRKACINNKWYEAGNVVNGVLIKKIDINSITIKKDNQERIINLH